MHVIGNKPPRYTCGQKPMNHKHVQVRARDFTISGEFVTENKAKETGIRLVK